MYHKIGMNKLSSLIKEGVYDPGILTGVFLAGGPGSGKSVVASQLFGLAGAKINLSPTGLKVSNSDGAFTHLLNKAGISLKLNQLSPKEFEQAMLIRSKAQDITKNQLEKFKDGRLGIIHDGTGEVVGKIQSRKNDLDELGYDTYMIFVNTSLDIALARNAKRERSLPDNVVTDIWNQTQQNIKVYKQMFGKNFIEIDNSNTGALQPDIIKAVTKFINRPIQNPLGQRWIQNMLTLKKAI